MKKVLIICVLVGVLFLLSFLFRKSEIPAKNKELAQSTGEADKYKKTLEEVYSAEKKRDENKPFGELLFGDSLGTVVEKLQNGNMKQVVATSSDNVFAVFSVNGDDFFVTPDFYDFKLFRVVIKGMKHNHLYGADRDYETLVKMIKDKYGPPDSDDGNSCLWSCGKKQIFISSSLSRAMCIIDDETVSRVIKKNRDKEVEEKSRQYF